ncbi:MAG: SprB repeat-containing protein [Saprospiraceae bacterium]|nr:SprB repeat-containing protein [Saprospiraceae bacterium]
MLTLSTTQVNVLCNGAATGSIDLTVTGGTGAYTYSWTGGATTQDRSGLAPGTYTVTVTDANACTKTSSATITEATAIVLSTTQVNVLCNGAATGSIDLTVSGGTFSLYLFVDGRRYHTRPLGPFCRHLHRDGYRCEQLHENKFHNDNTTHSDCIEYHTGECTL